MTQPSDTNGQKSMPAGTSQTDGFGTTAMQRSGETAMSAAAAQAQALVQARYIVAMQRPRDIDNTRVKLLAACRRPGFAKTARYHKPVGQGITGPSIRFAEEAMRCLTNVDCVTQVTFDDAEKRLIRVAATDLESNLSFQTDIVVEKTVERSKAKDGEFIKKRRNSYGRDVYLVAATEDDLLNKTNALVSKALRTNGLRLLPGDILEECMRLVVEVQANEDAKDPDAARKAVVDAFAGLGAKPSELKDYLGHDVGSISPHEIAHLRALYTAIKDGDTTWSAAMESRGGKTGEKPPTAAASSDLKERVTKKVADAKAAKVATEPPKDGELTADQEAAMGQDEPGFNG